MNEKPIATEEPLHNLLRRRREELGLLQSEVAEALHVSAGCVTLWEAGRRRMDLSKLRLIAEILEIDAKELCLKALAEFQPLFSATLFGDCAIAHGDCTLARGVGPRPPGPRDLPWAATA